MSNLKCDSLGHRRSCTNGEAPCDLKMTDPIVKRTVERLYGADPAGSPSPDDPTDVRCTICGYVPALCECTAEEKQIERMRRSGGELASQAAREISALRAELATVKAERQVERDYMDDQQTLLVEQVRALEQRVIEAEAERDRLQQENREQQFAICSAAQSRNELEAALGVATERIQAAHSILAALQTLAEEWERQRRDFEEYEGEWATYEKCIAQLRERLSTATTKGMP